MNRRKFFSGLLALPFVAVLDRFVPKIRPKQELRQGIVNAYIEDSGWQGYKRIYIRRKDGLPNAMRVTPGKVTDVSEPKYTYTFIYGSTACIAFDPKCDVKVYRSDDLS